MPKKQITKKSLTRHRNRHKKPIKKAIGQQLVLLMFMLGSLAGALQALTNPGSPSVLAYATNVSHAGLLTSTNQHRASSGLGALALNSLLNSAAQAKANDMVAKNYWSHTSPDGRQPWDFIVATGYSYSMAGENLAYGALTSESTVQAWMNSPGHRANILKPEFTQVGFGYANSPNYQDSGPQTVIVAMYAKPYSAPAPAPAPTKPVTKPTQPATKPKTTTAPKTATTQSVKQSAKPQAKPVEKKESKPEKKVEEEVKKEEAPIAAQVEEDGDEAIAPVAKTQPIKRISLVTGNYSGWVVGLVTLVGVVSAAVFLYRHSKAWHRRIRKGEEFVVHHPLIDAVAVMAIIVVVVLIQNVGHIL